MYCCMPPNVAAHAAWKMCKKHFRKKTKTNLAFSSSGCSKNKTQTSNPVIFTYSSNIIWNSTLDLRSKFDIISNKIPPNKMKNATKWTCIKSFHRHTKQYICMYVVFQFEICALCFICIWLYWYFLNFSFARVLFYFSLIWTVRVADKTSTTL